MSLFLATDDTNLAAHLALAIHAHRDALAKRQISEPVGLAEFEQHCLRLTKAHDGSAASNAGIGNETRRDDIERGYLSLAEASKYSGLSVATIKRRIKTGDLLSSLVGRRRLIARDDLDGYLRGHQYG